VIAAFQLNEEKKSLGAGTRFRGKKKDLSLARQAI